MIDIKELSIGNWIKNTNGNIGKVIGIENYCSVIIRYSNNSTCYSEPALLEGIPLTPEILKKNGWRLGKYSSATLEIENKIVVLEFYESGTQLRIFNRAVDEGLQILDIRISGIHQLQNALTLCGINKEIKL